MTDPPSSELERGLARLVRPVTRRELLAFGLAAVGAGLARRLGAQAPRVPTAAAGDTLGAIPEAGRLIRNARPLDAEAPLAALRTYETPNESFFVRSHFGPPTAIPSQWMLAISGEVERPLALSLPEIQELPAVGRAVTLECAGNGRGRYRLANTSGVQWGLGAVSTAIWTGVPLATLLDRAGLRDGALHFWMEAADHAILPDTPHFFRSIPREAALDDALIAYEMNGEPIPLLNGGPLRLVVPTWFGMSSTKWLTHVHARPTPSDNFFMTPGYHYPDGTPVERMRVKSLITRPLEGERVPVGAMRVTGNAWTGTGRIRQVELSADGGRGWVPARLVGPDQDGAWRQWEAELDVTAAGEQAVRARATDTAGNVQPMQAAPNPSGYGNNSIHEVRVHAVRA